PELLVPEQTISDRDRMKKSQAYRYLAVVIVLFVSAGTALAAKISTAGSSTAKRTTRKVNESSRTQAKISRLRHSRRVKYTRRNRRHRYYERFTASSFATSDLTSRDVAGGEDPVV